MARIHDDDIDGIKRNIDLVELCRSRGIELKKHGSRDFIGKCPFHQDGNPSFVVTPSKNLFHCLGCDAAGSVIDFVMKLDGLDFRAAVDKLLGSTPKIKRGSDLAASAFAQGYGGSKEKKTVPPERARQLLERVIAIYAKNFTETPEGGKYLEGRGITDAGLFTQHRIGYSNGRLKEILPSRRRSLERTQNPGRDPRQWPGTLHRLRGRSGLRSGRRPRHALRPVHRRAEPNATSFCPTVRRDSGTRRR